METADRTRPAGLQAKTERLHDKLKKLRKRRRELEALKTTLTSEPARQRSLTDPDARAMATRRLGAGIVGYNVRMAVDAKHPPIVAHEVTNDSSDRSRLSTMALGALGQV